MPVQLRVDDYPFTKPEEAWRHTPQAFKAFDDVVPVRYLLGVIPGNLGAWPDHSILDAGKIVVGMHGINHSEKFLDLHGGNEFAAVPRGRHGWVLGHGLSILREHGLRQVPNVYMPPRNVIDEETVRGCKEAGFRAITVGPETDGRYIEFVDVLGIKEIASMPPFEYGRSDELIRWGAVEKIYSAHHEGRVVTLGLHWTWESNIGLGTLVELVGLLRPILRDFDV